MNAKTLTLNLKSSRKRRWDSWRDRFAYSNTSAVLGFAWVRVGGQFRARYLADVAG